MKILFPPSDAVHRRNSGDATWQHAGLRSAHRKVLPEGSQHQFMESKGTHRFCLSAPFLAVQNPLLEMSFLSTSLSMQTPGINDAASWQPRLFRLNSLDDILHVRDTHTQKQVTLRTRLTRPLSSPFFNVSDLAVKIIIFCRRLIRSCWFGPVFGRGEGHAATGCLPPHHTTAGPEPSFHQHVLLSQRCLQQLVRQSCVSFKTPQSR